MKFRNTGGPVYVVPLGRTVQHGEEIEAKSGKLAGIEDQGFVRVTPRGKGSAGESTESDVETR